MLISEFISNYKNHPVLFIGSGLSQRYLSNSYTWENLLKYIAFEIYQSNEKFTNLRFKHKNSSNGIIDFAKLATDLEGDFNAILENDRNGKFKYINDIFYNGKEFSRFKIYIAELLKELIYRDDIESEIQCLKKAGKNIASIITTNYDKLIEDIFGFEPLIGNDILLSNPYGSVYKIHGCYTNPESIIITANDYEKFHKRYELIQAQLISIFIHNPIIFLGYSISDENIKKILETVFSYIPQNSELAEKFKQNFLLVEYQENSDNQIVGSHNIQLNNGTFISINKISTDNYSEVYNSIEKLELPVSAMDIKKVGNILREIQQDGSNSAIKVHIVEDIDELKNSDKILAIGSDKTLNIEIKDKKDLLRLYFKIINDKSHLLVKCISVYTISSSEWFPAFGFSKLVEGGIIDEILANKLSKFKTQQKEKILALQRELKSNENRFRKFSSIDELFESSDIISSLQHKNLEWLILSNYIDLNLVKDYLVENKDNLNNTNFRKILCIYDFMMFSESELSK